MNKNHKKLSWFLRISVALVASMMLFLPTYSSGYSVYAATTSTSSDKNDDDQKAGIDLPGMGGSGGLLPGSGTTGTVQNGSTIGLGTTVTNPNVAANTSTNTITSTLMNASTTSSKEENFVEFANKYIDEHSVTIHHSDGTVTQYTTEETIATGFLKATSKAPGVVNKEAVQKFYLASKAKKTKGIQLKWHGKKSKGNFTLTLSKGVLTFFHAISAGVHFIAVFVLAYFGNYASAAKQFVNVISETIKTANTKNGIRFKVTGWIHIKKSKALFKSIYLYGVLQ